MTSTRRRFQRTTMPRWQPETPRAARPATARHAHQPQGADRRRGRAAVPDLRHRAGGPEAAEPAHRRAPQELFNVDHKPITDGLSKLPATYDGLARRRRPMHPSCRQGVPELTAAPIGDRQSPRPSASRRRASPAWPARRAESQVFFRLQLKAPPREPAAAETRPDPVPRRRPLADGDLTTLLALRAAERARALAAGDVDLLANDTSEQTRKLVLPEIRPREGDLQSARPAEAGLALPADGRHHHRRQPGQRPEFRSAGLRHRPGDGERLRHGVGPLSCWSRRVHA